jgi:hypothetical protein
MMGLRVVCLIGAVLTYGISLWIALTLIVGGAALPWCAVLIANNGPPRKRRAANAGVTPPPARSLPPADEGRTIDL